MSPAALGSVVLVSGDGQSGTPGLPLRDTLRAQVLSVTGGPMAGVAVTWTVTYGGATLTPPGQAPDSTDFHTITYGSGTLTTITDTSDINGTVSALLRLGPAPGVTHVVAAVADLPGVTFTATGRGLQAIQVTMGFETACAIDLQGRTWCWGIYHGDSGAAGKNYLPSLVAGNHHFTEIAAGDDQVCGLESSGAVWCWGLSLYGSLGGNAVDQQVYNYPIPLSGAPSFSHIFGSDTWTMCGVTADGTAYCWGNNGSGRVGSGDTALAVPSPEPVAGGHKFRSIHIGDSHTCGIALDGTAWCWGDNTSGLLGAGSAVANSATPVAVAGGYTFRALTTASDYSCGLTATAGWVCWGDVPDGAGPRAAPAPATSLDQFTEFAAGGGEGAAVSGPRAVSVPTFATTRDASSPAYLHAISGGFWAACALAQDGTVYCWGQNTGGELGNPDSFGYDGSWVPAHAVVVPPNY